MKVTIDIDVTPEEARRFLGLPDVERLQEQLLANAQEYLRDSGNPQVADFIQAAAQPMLAYQAWLQKMFGQGREGAGDSGSGGKDRS